MLIIAGVETNPDPTMEEILDERLTKMTGVLQNLIEGVNSKLDGYHAEWKGTKKEVEEMKQELGIVKNQMQEVSRLGNVSRNHNIVIFGLNELRNEGKWNRVLDLFSSELNIDIYEQNIDNLYWIGRRTHNRPLLVKFTSVLTRDLILERAKLLRGSKIKIGKDYDYRTRKIRRELLSYMWEARKNGQNASLYNDKLFLNGNIYDLEFCRKNFNKDQHGGVLPTRRSESPTCRRDQQQRRNSYNSQRQEAENSRNSTNQHIHGNSPQQHASFGIGFTQRDERTGSQHNPNAHGETSQRGERTECLTQQEGASNENFMDTISSPQGSLLRITRPSATNTNYYNLRNWVTKKP